MEIKTCDTELINYYSNKVCCPWPETKEKLIKEKDKNFFIPGIELIIHADCN